MLAPDYNGLANLVCHPKLIMKSDRYDNCIYYSNDNSRSNLNCRARLTSEQPAEGIGCDLDRRQIDHLVLNLSHITMHCEAHVKALVTEIFIAMTTTSISSSSHATTRRRQTEVQAPPFEGIVKWGDQL
ncbi:hypothetical protein EVAR_41741_1 [Eumeta japonica]|uniref:Uncharacterized protein n=1 Tax=Eumeta variegata TaxID=151549 RepID=A0A4C1W1F0_EUMVA|nr:hypothetical protein EVAR_41741_1 [Eumeta japonica]